MNGVPVARLTLVMILLRVCLAFERGVPCELIALVGLAERIEAGGGPPSLPCHRSLALRLPLGLSASVVRQPPMSAS